MDSLVVFPMTLTVLTTLMVVPMMILMMTLIQTVFSCMHYMTSQTVYGIFVNPNQPQPKKSKSMNQILLMELTLRNSKISSYLATFISMIVLMSLLQMKKGFYLSYHTLKDQLLAGSNLVLTNPTNSTHWIWNYQAFLSELENNFGPHDPIRDAEKSLSELVDESQTIVDA